MFFFSFSFYFSFSFKRYYNTGFAVFQWVTLHILTLIRYNHGLFVVRSRFVRRSFTARSSYEHCLMTLLSSIINCSNIALCSLSLNKKTAVCEEENDGLFLVKRRFIIPNSSFYKNRSRQHNSLRTGKYLKTFDKFNYKAKRRTFSKDKALLKVLSQLISG